MLPDVEVMVRDFLEGEVAADVVTYVPTPRPSTFVRVWRTGGTARNRVVDDAQVTVECWAGSKGAASDLSREVRGLIHAAATREALPALRRVHEVGGPYYDPDPESGADRYTFTAILRVRA